ncbi:hypothetical protein AVEN_207468-1 [Araneus ventricosus]|uniref:Transposase Tc1-like domain-containing protein n=1 Tax=Araneus ventricosus TaxID=182803 RepID=A0A4Y2EFS7_ARAVE|nr:hypothetical protein AVEN_207468-1 [Araneus ventricosus]
MTVYSIRSRRPVTYLPLTLRHHQSHLKWCRENRWLDVRRMSALDVLWRVNHLVLGIIKVILAGVQRDNWMSEGYPVSFSVLLMVD